MNASSVTAWLVVYAERRSGYVSLLNLVEQKSGIEGDYLLWCGGTIWKQTSNSLNCFVADGIIQIAWDCRRRKRGGKREEEKRQKEPGSESEKLWFEESRRLYRYFFSFPQDLVITLITTDLRLLVTTQPRLLRLSRHPPISPSIFWIEMKPKSQR